jgi:hypothetical protein
MVLEWNRILQAVTMLVGEAVRVRLDDRKRNSSG